MKHWIPDFRKLIERDVLPPEVRNVWDGLADAVWTTGENPSRDSIGAEPSKPGEIHEVMGKVSDFFMQTFDAENGAPKE